MLKVLETILKLLHPVTPFVTEEIWSVLPGDRTTIMTTSFPEPKDSRQDVRAVAAMDLLMGVISGIRTIRSEADVHPTRKIETILLCRDESKRELLAGYASSIRAMTRTEKLDIVETGMIPDDAGHQLFQDIEIVVPLKGLIDAAAELAKLEKERGKLEKELQQISGKLRNEKFLSNAPDEIVAKERLKQEEIQTRLNKNTESAARLKKLL
jgi:valyl-tRNA synthetase